jgi:hypothetical protein
MAGLGSLDARSRCKSMLLLVQQPRVARSATVLALTVLCLYWQILRGCMFKYIAPENMLL